MQLPFPFFKKKPEKVYYFCLYLTDSFLDGYVLDLNTGNPIVIASKRHPLTAQFEKILEDTDTLISELELQANIQLDKTIFFLNSYMIDPGTHEIKEPYKGTIKTLVRDLELEPLGYIDTQEAIHDYVKNKSIINSIFVEFNKSELGVFIYKGGSLIHYEYTPRTEQLGADIEQVLTNLPGKQILPAKMFLYGDIYTETTSEIAKYKWKEKTFIQHPTIEALKDEEFHNLLSESFVKEMSVETEPQEEAPEAEDKFGFVFGSDISDEEKPVSTHSQDTEESPQKKTKNSLAVALESVMHFFTSRKMSKTTKGNKKLISAGAGLLVLLGLFGAYEYFFHKATVTVYLESKEVSDTIELNLPISETSTSDEIALLKHVKVVDYSDKKTTTGTREVGEKAKGEVVIHNFDNAEKTIERGTRLKYKELVFTTDKEVKVASSSGITGDGTKQSGKSKVSVTASEIGDEYNISKGSQLTVADLSESLFTAIAEDNFTGGSKKKVNTVSKEDLAVLEESAEKEAKKKSGQILSSNISSSEILITDLSKVDLSETKYSKEVGEEAKEISINASAEIEYYTANKDKLYKAVTEEMKKQEKDGYILDPDTLQVDIKEAETNDDKVNLSLNAEVKLNKKVDIEEIKKAITFKSKEDLSSILKDTYSVEDAEVEEITPQIPLLSSWIPFFTKNITIETASN